MSDVTLTEFLLARIAEDEAVAIAAGIPAHDAPDAHKPHPALLAWRYAPWSPTNHGEVQYDWDDPGPYPMTYYVTCDTEGLSPAVDESVGPHIARHDPARVLAECDARRRIINLHSGLADPDCPPYGRDVDAGEPCLTLLALALPYADHPDFDESWRP